MPKPLKQFHTYVHTYVHIPQIQNLVKVTKECGISHYLQNTKCVIQNCCKYFKHNTQMLHQIHYTHLVIQFLSHFYSLY